MNRPSKRKRRAVAYALYHYVNDTAGHRVRRRRNHGIAFIVQAQLGWHS